MDIISHGLYGGVAFGRVSRYSYIKAFFFGIMPDLFSFGIFTMFTILGLASGPDWQAGTPDPSAIPGYVHHLYDVTHSLVVAAACMGAVWFVQKRLPLEMLAWPLHILVDIPTHSSAFFPTPFLWPLSDVIVDGVSWSHPAIYLTNVVLLIVLYTTWFVRTRKSRELTK